MFRRALFITLSAFALSYSAGAAAYMGPTLGLGVIGTAIAVLAVLLLSLFAFVFVPIRRMFKKSRKPAEQESDS